MPKYLNNWTMKETPAKKHEIFVVCKQDKHLTNLILTFLTDQRIKYHGATFDSALQKN